MDAITLITIVGTGIGVVAGCVQVADYMEKKRAARRVETPPAPAAVPVSPSPTPPVLPHDTVTFLLTDIEGSSHLWQEQPEAMRTALARQDALVRQAVDSHSGDVVKGTGDGMIAVFPAAPDAVRAAMEAQFALTAEPWGTQTPLRVRMALHTGTAEERDGDYFGPALNRVARLLAAAHAGQVLLSAATQELARDHLPEGARLHDLGEARLKDLSRPERVFQLLHPSLPVQFPLLHSLDNPKMPNNLPQQATSFIGREREVGEVKALLDKTRLLTLTGAGGSGKTRLALQGAADLLDGSGDGVWLVELASMTNPALVPQSVAAVLGVREEAGKPLARTLTEFLRPRRLLLILDNCEHLISACATLVTDLLLSCPGVHILVTSREPLGVSGEQTYRVPSLSLPDPKKPQTEATISQYEAVRLFIERAQAVQPAFAVTNANAPAVAQVCFHLDGIPLAIELAAARVRTLSVEEINSKLDSRFRLLTGGSRTALPRQQTLRALIDWSYDLLSEAEKGVLSRLSVFAGGWTLSAAEAICSGDTVEDFEVLDLLTSLADKSLIVAEAQGASSRYRLLETVRQYAGDRLAEQGESEAVAERHAAWYLSLAEQAEPQLMGPDQAAWLDRLETEHDNLRASLSWYEHRHEQDADAGLRLAGDLGRFWSVRGYLSEGRQWLGRALERTKGREAGQAASAVRAKALNGAGALAYYQGDYVAAQALHEESLAIKRLLGNQHGIANSLNNLGLVAEGQGDYTAAFALHQESLTIQRHLGNQEGLTNSLINLGNVAVKQGDIVAARALLEESLAAARQVGNQQSIAMSLESLGNVACWQGDYAGAKALLEESLAIARKLGSQQGIASAQGNLGNVALRYGDLAAAFGLHQESLTIRRQLGDQEGIASNLEGMAAVACGQNQPSRAAQLLGATARLREIIGSRPTPAEQAEIGGRASSLRAALGEDAFAAAWKTGRAMTLEQAVEYALSDEG